jgi:hypothetical protein
MPEGAPVAKSDIKATVALSMYLVCQKIRPNALIIPQCTHIFRSVRQRLASFRTALLGRFLPRLGPLPFDVGRPLSFVPCL